MKQSRQRSDCPISSALDIFGDKWSLLVMRDLLIPLLLQMMLWSAEHNPQTAAPGALITELKTDLGKAAQAIRQQGGIQAFLASL